MCQVGSGRFGPGQAPVSRPKEDRQRSGPLINAGRAARTLDALRGALVRVIGWTSSQGSEPHAATQQDELATIHRCHSEGAALVVTALVITASGLRRPRVRRGLHGAARHRLQLRRPRPHPGDRRATARRRRWERGGRLDFDGRWRGRSRRRRRCLVRCRSGRRHLVSAGRTRLQRAVLPGHQPRALRRELRGLRGTRERRHRHL